MILWLLLCVAPPAVEPDTPLRFNMSYMISKDAKIYLELPASDVEPKVKVLTKPQFKRNGHHILQMYNVSQVVVRDGEITQLYLTLKEVVVPEAPKRSDIATKP